MTSRVCERHWCVSWGRVKSKNAEFRRLFEAPSRKNYYGRVLSTCMTYICCFLSGGRAISAGWNISIFLHLKNWSAHRGRYEAVRILDFLWIQFAQIECNCFVRSPIIKESWNVELTDMSSCFILDFRITERGRCYEFWSWWIQLIPIECNYFR